MKSKAKRTVFIYSVLLLSTIARDVQCQVSGFVSPGGTVGQHSKGFTTSNTFSTTATNTWKPISNFNTHPAAKGYYTATGWNGYSSYPLNTQYWTGNPAQYIPYHQYSYNSYPYEQYPGQYVHYPQPYGYVQHQTGYNQYYGKYPNFNAGYWMGQAYHPAHLQPIYMQHPAVYMPHPPVYHQPPMYYQPVFYNGHWVSQPIYAHPGKYHDRGFLGGTGGDLVTGLLGAVLVGTIAGKVARG
ncbi:hypothetical protein ACF0H5_016082 [Mactra antiquata]